MLEREIVYIALQMLRGMIWIHNIFTWQEKLFMDFCNSMAFLGLCKCLLNFWASRQNWSRNGYQKSPAEQTRWEHAQKNKKNKIILANESTGEEIWGVSLSKCDCRLQSESLSDSMLIFFSWFLPGMEQGNKMAGVASSICFLLIQTASALVCQGVRYCTCAVSEMFTITVYFK